MPVGQFLQESVVNLLDDILRNYIVSVITRVRPMLALAGLPARLLGGGTMPSRGTIQVMKLKPLIGL